MLGLHSLVLTRYKFRVSLFLNLLSLFYVSVPVLMTLVPLIFPSALYLVQLPLYKRILSAILYCSGIFRGFIILLKMVISVSIKFSAITFILLLSVSSGPGNLLLVSFRITVSISHLLQGFLVYSTHTF